jgi:hypothetical protein
MPPEDRRDYTHLKLIIGQVVEDKLDIKLQPVIEEIAGNGKPGLKVQVAKLETAMKVVAVVGTTGLGIALTLLFK